MAAHKEQRRAYKARYDLVTHDAKLAYQQQYEATHKEERKIYGKTHRKMEQDWNHRTGRNVPLSEAKEHPGYLGVVVAERLLTGVFQNVERMPMGNPGFDFYCGKRYKIDVKASCLSFRQCPRSSPKWEFSTKKNQIADYFACIAFDNRQELNPVHFWIIPASEVANKTTISVSNVESSLSKVRKYERPIDNILSTCNQLKGVV
ncbi:MAG: hypothetical protein PHS46_07930 [Candidatus Omnitrophica bacterium]|nr:hypothetical protein [Candidatus Omnitrophota bacterium]